MLTLPEIARSRYLLYRGLADVFGTHRACLAVDVLMGPQRDQADDDAIPGEGEPLEGPGDEFPAFQPTEADWEEACAMFDRMDLPPWPADYPDYVSDRDIMVLQGGAG